MAFKIHHATLAKAKKYGIELRHGFDDIEAHHDGKLLASGNAGNAVLAAALAALNIDPAAAPEKKPRKAASGKKAAKKKAASGRKKTADDETPDHPEGRSIVKQVYREKYKEFGGHNGDPVALALEKNVRNGDGSIDVAVLKKIAQDNEIWAQSYAQLNVGQQRMIVSNRLRSLVRNGQSVKIGKTTVKGQVGT